MTVEASFVGVTLLSVIAVFALKPTRKLANHFITVLHEFGHAIVALFLGGKIQGIRVNSDGSGVTTSAHVVDMRYIPIRIITLLAGYSFPIFFGFTLVWFYFNSYTLAAVIVFGCVSGISFIFLRNFFGFFIMLLFAGVTVGTYFIPWDGYSYVVLGLGVLFSLFGIKDAIQISKAVYSSLPNLGSDFNLLKDQTHIPAKFWVIVFWLVQFGLVALIILLTQKFG